MTSKLNKMCSALWLVCLPTALVVVAHLGGDPEQLNAVPGTAAVALSDPKILRTVKRFSPEDISPMDATRLRPVDRVGITFRFTMPPALQHRFWVDLGQDKLKNIGTREVSLSIEDGPSFTCLIRGRGQATSHQARKSFLVNLLSAQRFTADIECRKLLLLNLGYDPYGFNHRFAYLILNELGLFPSYNQFAVVSINGKAQGLYLIVERPEDAIKRTRKDIVSVMRMGSHQGSHEHEIKYASPRSSFVEILEALRVAYVIGDPEIQAETFNNLVDLDAYMKWLAFNSLVQNADSVDEVFFHETRRAGEALGRLGLVAWDYDDLQHSPSHPPHVYDDPLMWAVERRLDLAIIENELLYSRFKKILKELLDQRLTPKYLRDTLARVKSDLDSLDTGLPRAQQTATFAEREIAAREFETQLLERRAFLLRSVP